SYGDAWGPLRPNATFGTTWPAGAEGKQVAISIGARACNPANSGGECATSRFITFMAEKGSFNSITNGFVWQNTKESDDLTNDYELSAAIKPDNSGFY